MKIKNATFITSVADSGKFYKTNKPIIAVAGKSNVGKSSVINMLAGNGKLARTSVTPGRTRLINYFDFGEFVLADLPGYGFAKVSKSEKDKWGKLMDDFLKTEDLALLITLPLTGSRVHSQNEIGARLVASLLNRLQDNLDCFLITAKVRREAALITNGGSQSSGF